jgi:hypothetical protein
LLEVEYQRQNLSEWEMNTMKTNRLKSSSDDLENRATEALRALLAQVSVIKLKEIRHQSKGPMIACVEVLGHSYTLACEIKLAGEGESLRNALRELRNDLSCCDGAATPVLIAPHFSPEAQALCKESATGYLDLEGNARLALGEVFIGKRSMPCRAAERRGANELRSFPPVRAAHHAPVAGRSATA